MIYFVFGTEVLSRVLALSLQKEQHQLLCEGQGSSLFHEAKVRIIICCVSQSALHTSWGIGTLASLVAYGQSVALMLLHI